MAYSLRLPDALDTDARERCQRLGISLNALLCVALDAYLRGASPAPAAAAGFEPDGTARPTLPAKPAVQASPQPGIPKLTKAHRREITRLERAARKF